MFNSATVENQPYYAYVTFSNVQMSFYGGGAIISSTHILTCAANIQSWVKKFCKSLTEFLRLCWQIHSMASRHRIQPTNFPSNPYNQPCRCSSELFWRPKCSPQWHWNNFPQSTRCAFPCCFPHLSSANCGREKSSDAEHSRHDARFCGQRFSRPRRLRESAGRSCSHNVDCRLLTIVPACWCHTTFLRERPGDGK